MRSAKYHKDRLANSSFVKKLSALSGLKTGQEEHPKVVTEDKRFVLCGGSSLGSIEELAHTLDTLPDDQFRFHVNDSKNDFANWIRDVFGEPVIADSIAGIRDKKDLQITLLKHIAVKR